MPPRSSPHNNRFFTLKSAIVIAQSQRRGRVCKVSEGVSKELGEVEYELEGCDDESLSSQLVTIIVSY